MKDMTLRGKWIVKAPLKDVFTIMTDFESFPKNFPKVAASTRVVKREGDYLEIEAGVRSFGQLFPVSMKTHIFPGRGFISDNKSPKFGTSGHEEFLLSKHPDGTMIEYSYQIAIHKPWLRFVAGPLIKGYSMKFWEKAVIWKLREMLER